MTYYAYIHARPETTDQSGVFYVGKGVGTRRNPTPHRNRYHGAVVKKPGADRILVGSLDCSDEATAFELEIGLIKCLRRAGVTLTNMTDGGEGTSGFSMPQSAKDKISAHARIMAADPVIRQKRSAFATAKNERDWADPEYRAKTSEAMRGKKKTRTEASDTARRENAKKSSTPEANAKKAEAARLRWSDPEFRAKMAAKKRAAWQDPEQRAAMLAGRSEGISKSWENPETRAKRIRGIKNPRTTT